MNIYETHVMNDPAIPCIFHLKTHRSPHAGHCYPNWHENVEILHITKGSAVILADTLRWRSHAGDIVVFNPNCLHDIIPEEEPVEYDCLIVDRAFCLANYFDTNLLQFDTHFRDETIADLMTMLAKEYTPPIQQDFRIQTIRAILLQIMARLCRTHSHAAKAAPKNTHPVSCIKQAIGLIRSQSHRDLSLDEVCGFVGLSKSYFVHEFHHITGYTFVSYINFTRCEKAKVLLAENRLSIGDVGKACGFPNQSYFSRTFRKYVGMLPGAYRKSKTAQ